KYKLGDLCRIASSKRIFESEYVEKGVPFIRGQEISDGSILDPKASFECYISQSRYEEIKEKYGKPTKGDILITAVGTIGNLCYLDKDIDFYFKDGNVIWFSEIISSCEGKFLFHFMKSSFFKDQLKYFMIGAVQKALTIDMLKKVEVPLPPLSEQKKIASVLSALDDKIALNKKMNQKLEAMAKRLYGYWFVQYDFPDKNGHPYKTTGGPMTYNETLKREIPVGWEVSNICPLMEILPGGTPSKAKPEYWNGDIPFFGPTDYCGDVYQLSTEEHITEKGLNNCASALYPPKTIFITARGSVGKLIVCGKPMAMNQSCYALKPFDLEKYEYLFYLTKQLIEQLKKKGSGSVFRSINTLDIEQSFMSVAPNEIIDLYCKKVKSIFERIKGNTVEIAKLTALRDKLLPLLMNGQVVVG
ncbi:restriction endonuclease subunit S, partial [Candidatus Saccharibacteria bacterium]|nr:restriction endonuclease subunit S [Candidatus Saccharibacteria bacterium]